jgi:thiol-disulfide isomerase/thioredoxin
MLSISLAAVVLCVQGQTPKEWQDQQLDADVRESMEQLISFAPPPFPENTHWYLSEGETAPTWSGLQGKVVIVQSWSNTDAKGRQIVSVTDKLIHKTKTPNDVVHISLHTPEGTETLEEHLSKYPNQPPTVIDSTGDYCNQFGFYTQPTNVIIDRNGTVQYVGVGTKGIVKAINQLLDTPQNKDVKVKPFTAIATIEKPAEYPTHSTNVGKSTNWQGKQAPAFYVEEWLANPIDDVEDKVRVVEFWATWCPPCRKSIPHLNEYSKHFGEDVAFVGVSNESADKVREFMKKTPMEYGVALDKSGKMKNTISCSAIPLAMVISSDGIVRWQGNPLRMPREVIESVLMADRGEMISKPRGRWKVSNTKTNE